MPPKKDPKASSRTLADNDFSDVASLCQLNDFVFTTMYAFKYRKTQVKVIEALSNIYDMSSSVSSTDSEIQELMKRIKIIDLKMLMEQIESKTYLTPAEIQEANPVKMQQVLARATNDLLVSIQLPLRREKMQWMEVFQSNLATLTDPTEKKNLQEALDQKLLQTELTVWLKDFPKTASDFKELRRSAAQHMPEVDLAVHAAVLIEEKFKRNYDDIDDGSNAGPTREVTAENAAEEAAAKEKLEREEFSNLERQNTYKDLLYINKYSQNCPVTSQQKLLVPHKIQFVGPDPPPEDLLVSVIDQSVVLTSVETTQKSKKGAEVVAAPVEVHRSPAVISAEKKIKKFANQFSEVIQGLQNDLNLYRSIIGKTKFKPLWPKTLTPQQIQEIKEKEAAERKEKEKAEAVAAQEAALVLAAANTKGKPAPVQVKKVDSRPASQLSTSRPATSAAAQKKIDEAAGKSQDEEPREWNFSTFTNVFEQMKTESTSVGSIVGAMLYHIEQQNNSTHQLPVQNKNPTINARDSQKSQSYNGSKLTVFDKNGSRSTNYEQKVEEEVDSLKMAIDDLFNKLKIENAVLETDFKKQFNETTITALKNENQTPYQTVINQQDRITQISDSYKFLNGKQQGNYEKEQLEKIQIPGINDRFQMPKKETRQQSERESDTREIVKNCTSLPENKVKRMLTLKSFQELLQSSNPERTYNFMDRNYQESFDASTFRQILTQALRSGPDVNTSYYDAEDALLLALNFKNPPGRLLRRQWTQKLDALPDYHTWQKYKDQLTIPDTVLNIPQQNLSMVRQNQKFCYPCDNSVIKVCKNYVGSRRFGSSNIIKDNYVMGIKETATQLEQKVSMDDDILNFDTRKATDRRCEFWLEFENGVKMQAEILDPVTAPTELIPPSEPGSEQISKPVQKQVIIRGESNKPGLMQSLEVNKSSVESRDSINSREVGQSILKSSVSAKIPEGMNESGRGDSAQTQKKPDQVISNNPSDNYTKNKGSSLTFTFQEGLIVQILPNGSVQQTIVKDKISVKKSTIQQEVGDENEEIMRTVTRDEGSIIRYLKDGNQIIYFKDGTITKTDHRRGIWTTINSKGIIRERNVRSKIVRDEISVLECQRKVDPETTAVIQIREDGFLKIDYPDKSCLMIFPDHTRISIQKSAAQDEDAKVVQTLYQKDGYSPVKITYDPIKARAQTTIGLGGADALMGRDGIMERSHGGLISETFLPDRTIVQTYLEKQELPGYNRSCKSLIHLVKRDDFSIIKVRQDGELVIITANERAYLNSIGKDLAFGTKDYDYFFEIFGMPLERRSGVYTVNLDQGKIWTQDEEGNFFIIYSNGDSTEKLSVSFNLDQLVEGIENKEPSSPRIPNGEFILDECKFLPPPKNVTDPRLFLIKNKTAIEFKNFSQLEHHLRTQEKDTEIQKTHAKITFNNEQATSHLYLKKEKQTNAEDPSTLRSTQIPKIPQALEMVNQTVSIPVEPEKSRFTRQNIIEFEPADEDQVQTLYHAIQMRDSLRQKQRQEAARLLVNPRDLPKDQLETQTKIWLRIAKQRGINVDQLIDAEYKNVKTLDRDQLRANLFAKMDKNPAAGAESTNDDSS